MTMLKYNIGIVGDNADDMIKLLLFYKIYDKSKIKNSRHALLIQSQASFQVM